eukprot:g3991.t1
METSQDRVGDSKPDASTSSPGFQSTPHHNNGNAFSGARYSHYTGEAEVRALSQSEHDRVAVNNLNLDNQELQKLNFNMKLRIFYLEERLAKLMKEQTSHDGRMETLALEERTAIEAAHAKETESLREENNKLQRMVNEKERELEKRNILLVKARSAIEQLQQELRMTALRLEEQERNHANELRRIGTDQDRSLRDSELRYSELQRDSNRAMRESALMQTQIRNYESNKSTLERENRDLQEKVRDAKHQFDKVAMENAAAQRELADLRILTQTKLPNNEARLAKVQSEMELTRTKCTELEKQLALKSEQVERYRTREHEILQQQKDVARLEADEIARLEKEVTLSRSTAEESRRFQSAREKQIQDLQDDLRTTLERAQKAERRAEKSTEELERMKDDNLRREEELTAESLMREVEIRRELSEREAALQRMNAELAGKLTALEFARDDIQRRLDLEKSVTQQKQTRIETLEDRLRDLEAVRSKLDALLKATQEKSEIEKKLLSKHQEQQHIPPPQAMPMMYPPGVMGYTGTGFYPGSPMHASYHQQHDHHSHHHHHRRHRSSIESKQRQLEELKKHEKHEAELEADLRKERLHEHQLEAELRKEREREMALLQSSTLRESQLKTDLSHTTAELATLKNQKQVHETEMKEKMKELEAMKDNHKIILENKEKDMNNRIRQKQAEIDKLWGKLNESLKVTVQWEGDFLARLAEALHAGDGLREILKLHHLQGTRDSRGSSVDVAMSLVDESFVEEKTSNGDDVNSMEREHMLQHRKNVKENFLLNRKMHQIRKSLLKDATAVEALRTSLRKSLKDAKEAQEKNQQILQDEIDKLNSSLEEANRKCEVLEEQVETSKGQIQEITTENEAVKADLDTREKEVNEWINKNGILKSNLSALEQESDRTKVQYERLIENEKEESARLLDDIKEHKEQESRLREVLDQEKTQKQRLQENVQVLKLELEEKERLIVEWESRLDDEKLNVREEEARTEALHSTIEAMRHRFAEKDNSLREIAEQMAEEIENAKEEVEKEFEVQLGETDVSDPNRADLSGRIIKQSWGQNVSQILLQQVESTQDTLRGIIYNLDAERMTYLKNSNGSDQGIAAKKGGAIRDISTTGSDRSMSTAPVNDLQDSRVRAFVKRVLQEISVKQDALERILVHVSELVSRADAQQMRYEKVMMLVVKGSDSSGRLANPSEHKISKLLEKNQSLLKQIEFIAMDIKKVYLKIEQRVTGRKTTFGEGLASTNAGIQNSVIIEPLGSMAQQKIGSNKKSSGVGTSSKTKPKRRKSQLLSPQARYNVI